MKMKVLLFGELAQIAGTNTFELDMVSDSEAALKILFNKLPGISGKKFAVAVNKRIITENTYLNDGDEIALLPPFSGG